MARRYVASQYVKWRGRTKARRYFIRSELKSFNETSLAPPALARAKFMRRAIKHKFERSQSRYQQFVFMQFQPPLCLTSLAKVPHLKRI